jgi:hypothetical protein
LAISLSYITPHPPPNLNKSFHRTHAAFSAVVFHRAGSEMPNLTDDFGIADSFQHLHTASEPLAVRGSRLARPMGRIQTGFFRVMRRP